MRALSGLLLLALLLTSGCRVGPRYTPPCIEVPEQWKTVEMEEPARRLLLTIGGKCPDETLNTLEVKAIENNPQLYTALQRVAEARGMAAVAGAGLYPQIQLQPSYSDTGQLFKLYLPQQLLPRQIPTYQYSASI